MAAASRRRMRTQAEWNVLTHIFRATGPDQRRDPLAHLVGRLVGEGDGQDAHGVDAVLADQVGDAVGQDPGLARAGPGHDQQRTVGVDDGVELVGVEPVDQGDGRVDASFSDGTTVMVVPSYGRGVALPGSDAQPALTKLAPFGAPRPGQRVVAVQRAQRLQVGVDGADRRAA